MSNIAFIDVTATNSFGGVQIAVWRLAAELADMGHEVTIYGGDGADAPLQSDPRVRVSTHSFRPRDRFPDFGNRFRKLMERTSFAIQALPSVRSANHDWIILTKPFDFFWPFLPGIHPRTKFAFMSGGTDFFRGDRWLGKRIAAWMSCSHFNAWELRNRYKTYPKVIYNGVNTNEFSPGTRNLHLRRELGVHETDVLLGYAGRLVQLKGLHTALEALAEARESGSALKLLIVGEGPQAKALREKAADLKADGQVIFHPAVTHNQLPQFYSAMDIGIFPSTGAEAFGISIAEAMSTGLPIISTYLGGIPEVVGNEGTSGILTPPGDTHSLALAIRTLAQDSVLRESMGRKARERILKLYTWRQSAERLATALAINSEQGITR